MKRLSKEKQQQLILAILFTCMALVGIWFFVIKAQRDSLAKLSVRTEIARDKLSQFKRAIERADEVESELGVSRKELGQLEEKMASGDLYAWAINTLRAYKLDHKGVEIPQFSQIDGPKDVTLLAGFPYKQASLTISGTAKFHDLGRFLADFENQFPHARLLNLSVEPASGLTAVDREALSFKLEIAALVKPNAS